MRKLFVVLTAVVLVLGFTLPTMAADAQWGFYGSARMWTAYEKASKETLPILTNTSESVSGATMGGTFGSRTTAWGLGTLMGAQEDVEVDWRLQGNSRIGANVKWGDIGGRFEYGSTPNLRLLYGTWNFMKDAQILVGQDYTPFFYLPSGMCGPGGGECNGIGLGSIYGGRVPQLKLVYSGFQFALLSPSSSVNPVLPNLAFVSVPGAPPPVATTPFAATIPAVRDNDQTIPKIEAAWNGNIGPVGLFIGGQYNQYKVEFQDPVLATNKADVTVSSWAIGAGGKFAMGPFWVAAAGVYSKNPANGGQLISLIPTVMLYDSVTKKSEDATWWSGQGIVGFKMSDMMSFEGGIVYQNGKVKSPVATAALIFPDIEETSINWYVQAVISPAKNFYIVPEVGSINFGDLKVTSFADRKMGDIFWFGVKWQINF